jgi:hypothetical protein
MMNLTEIRDFLLENDYLQEDGERFVLTPNFYRDLKEQTRKQISDKLSPAKKLLSEGDIFKRFLRDAEVPKFQEKQDGSTFVIGAYSKSAAKELSAILRKGYLYERLCLATANYYKTVSYCVSIAKFLKEGIWETYYESVDEDKAVSRSSRSTNKTLG